MQQTYIIDHPKPYPSFPLLSPRTAPPPIPVCGLRRYLASPLCPTAPPPQERPGRARTPPPWRVRGGARGGRGHIRPAAPPPTARRPLPRRRDGPVKSRGGHSGGGIWSGRRRTADDGERRTTADGGRRWGAGAATLVTERGDRMRLSFPLVVGAIPWVW
jgi:hypothetical protein